MRVVLDTNCVVSALLFDGSLAWLRHAWQGGRVVPLLSSATAGELLRVLAYPKFRLTAGEREDLLAEFVPFAETVAIGHPPPRVPTVSDPDDRPFLQLAVAGRAAALVTGDRAILACAREFRIPIWRPAELRARLGERGATTPTPGR